MHDCESPRIASTSAVACDAPPEYQIVSHNSREGFEASSLLKRCINRCMMCYLLMTSRPPRAFPCSLGCWMLSWIFADALRGSSAASVRPSTSWTRWSGPRYVYRMLPLLVANTKGRFFVALLQSTTRLTYGTFTVVPDGLDGISYSVFDKPFMNDCERCESRSLADSFVFLLSRVVG